MNNPELYRRLSVDTSALQTAGFNPYYRPLNGLQHGEPWINRRPFFDLASNDYLGLASDVRIHEAIAAAAEEWGSSLCGTPIACGYARVLEQLERELAAFLRLESAVVFPSCYQANVALFPAIAGPGDLLLVDHYAHASLVQGVKASGGTIKPFLHQDLDHLERALRLGAGNYRQMFVVTEGVFSTEGSVAPLHELVELCRRHGAVPVVDDSHGLGVLGKTGRGSLEENSVDDFPGIYTASLGKALANVGGVVAGDLLLINALKYSCPGLIYSTALPPANAAGTLRALHIIQQEFGSLGRACRHNHELLQEALAAKGYPLIHGGAPIASIQTGSTENTLTKAREFFEHRILSTPFVPPSVPDGKGVLRLIVGAKLNHVGTGELVRALQGIPEGRANSQASQRKVAYACETS